MMKVLCTRAAKCESGATAIEYALTAAILSVALLTGADTLGEVVSDKFASLSQKVETASRDTGPSGGGTKLISTQFETDTQVMAISFSSPAPQP